ncbi:hypothetical protein V5799_032734 [Amblyomma americanum]|uniref:Uncharacterized protein n=1 Tax=Amblyomma americanum TaxID=6943 RepID=A0AAQ4DQB7_AMBAM
MVERALDACPAQSKPCSNALIESWSAHQPGWNISIIIACSGCRACFLPNCCASSRTRGFNQPCPHTHVERQPGQARICEDAPREQAPPTTCMEWSHSSDDGGGGSTPSASLLARALMAFALIAIANYRDREAGP